MSDYQPHVGRTLAAARVAAGWSQKELARRLGLHPGRVAQWETGKRPIHSSMVALAAEALGLDRDALDHLGEILECAHERRADRKFDPTSLRTMGSSRLPPPTKEERRERAGQLVHQAMALLIEVAQEEQPAE